MKKAMQKVGLGLGSALVAGSAFAQSSGGIDVSGVVTSLGQIGTAVATVGGALLAAAAIAVAYKWIKGFMFG